MDPLGRQKRAAEGCSLMKTTLTVIGSPFSEIDQLQMPR